MMSNPGMSIEKEKNSEVVMRQNEKINNHVYFRDELAIFYFFFSSFSEFNFI